MSAGARIEAALADLERAAVLLKVMVLRQRVPKQDLDEAIQKTETALGRLRDTKEGKRDG